MTKVFFFLACSLLPVPVTERPLKRTPESSTTRVRTWMSSRSRCCEPSCGSSLGCPQRRWHHADWALISDLSLTSCRRGGDVLKRSEVLSLPVSVTSVPTRSTKEPPRGLGLSHLQSVARLDHLQSRHQRSTSSCHLQSCSDHRGLHQQGVNRSGADHNQLRVTKIKELT